MAKLKGQALVETAIIAPILILMFLGVFEVGFALRNYLVLSNANREAARFAAKPNQDDNPAVFTHTIASIAGQVPYTGVFLIQRVLIEPQRYCEPPCDCNRIPISPTLISILPSYTHPLTAEVVTRFDWNEVIKRSVETGELLTCMSENSGATVWAEEIVLVEMWYDHYQLFGLFWFADPLPMYMHSVFRKAVDRDPK